MYWNYNELLKILSDEKIFLSSKKDVINYLECAKDNAEEIEQLSNSPYVIKYCACIHNMKRLVTLKDDDFCNNYDYVLDVCRKHGFLEIKGKCLSFSDKSSVYIYLVGAFENYKKGLVTSEDICEKIVNLYRTLALKKGKFINYFDVLLFSLRVSFSTLVSRGLLKKSDASLLRKEMVTVVFQKRLLNCMKILKENCRYDYQKLAIDDFILRFSQFDEKMEIDGALLNYPKEKKFFRTFPNDIPIFEGKNFGVRFSSLLNVLGINLGKFAMLSGISVSTLRAYSNNKFLPSTAKCIEIIETLEELDKSNYMIQQVQAINNFIIFLKELKIIKEEKRIIDESKIFLDTDENSEFRLGTSGDIEKDVPKEVLDKVKKLNSDWYQEYLEYLQGNEFGKGKKSSSVLNSKWYIKNVNLVLLGTLSGEQALLLEYLKVVDSYLSVRRALDEFLKNLDALEEFVYKENRAPKLGENMLGDGSSLFSFYKSVRDFYYNYKESPNYINDEIFLRIKNVFVVLEKRDFNLKTDKVIDNRIYLGNALNRLRVSLRFTYISFADRLGINGEKLKKYYKNIFSVSDEDKLKIVGFLRDLDYSTLRKDQISDIEEFLNILKTGKIKEDDILKKKFEN